MQDKTSANIIGPDLNEYRGEVDYDLLATRTNFCYLRGSGNGSGKFRSDKKFIEYVRGLKNVGIKTGAYHYAVPSYDLTTADEQCDGFIEILQQAYGPGKYGDLFPVIDIEAPIDKSISTDALLDWVDRFRKRFERKTRRTLMLYTGAFFIELYNNFFSSTKGFVLSDMPLWIAMYPEIQPNPPYPQDQGGWTRWRMWQYTENGIIPGVTPPVDLNYGPVNLDLLMQPRDVSNLNAVAQGTSIRVTWDRNRDIDIGGYNVFINSNYVTTVGRDITSYTIELGKEQNPGQRYKISVEAFDIDGDFSPNRTSVMVVFPDTTVVPRQDGHEEEEYEEEDFIDYSELDDRKTEKKAVYSDPVDRLVRMFIYEDGLNNFEAPYENADDSKDSIEGNDDNDNNEADDFVEFNGEFDDERYLERIRKTMERCRDDNPSDNKPQGCCKKCCKKAENKHDSVHEAEYDSQKDKEDDTIEWELLEECDGKCKNGHKKVKVSKKNMYDDSDSDSDSDSDEEDITDKCKERGEFIYKEKYEGDRRRDENRDKHGKGPKYDEDNDCYGMPPLSEIYLKNCDYGYDKHSKHKGHGSIYYGKKKKHHH